MSFNLTGLLQMLMVVEEFLTVNGVKSFTSNECPDNDSHRRIDPPETE